MFLRVIWLCLYLLISAVRFPAWSCTAFVMRGGGTVLLAKNLDWAIGDGFVFVNKKGVSKEAFSLGTPSRLRWTSKYGSVTFNQFGREFPLGGMNEAGLVIEELNAGEGCRPTDSLLLLNEFQWVQYHLDNHRSVKEMLKNDPGLRISRLLLYLHYLVTDRKGNTAVIECAGGKMTYYAGDELPVPVLSNNGYAESLRYLRLHRGFGGDRVVSGGPGSGKRFVRAATLLEEYRLPAQRPLPDHAFTVLKSVEQDDTQWSIVYYLPRRLILFKTKANRRLKIINLGSLDFSCKTPALMLPVNTEAVRNLSRSFSAYDPGQNRSLLDLVFGRLKDMGELDDLPVDDLISRMAGYPETCRCR
ncbi:MAG: linear amide C-N hydrolase [Candidatus Aminicenantes bacterium]|nr:linear amide C-N hydrolase [Candidatus Aminicenantes bacterium]